VLVVPVQLAVVTLTPIELLVGALAGVSLLQRAPRLVPREKP
jgi:hypothetical protein